MSKKDKLVLYNIEIESVAAEGNSLARVDGKVLFVLFLFLRFNAGRLTSAQHKTAKSKSSAHYGA